MNFTPEQLTKAKAANSAEELLAYANEVGFKLTEDEAKSFFDKWHGNGELSDDELDNVSGGCGGISSDDPHCTECGGLLVWNSRNYPNYNSSGSMNPYDLFACTQCDHKFRHYWYGDLWTEDEDPK